MQIYIHSRYRIPSNLIYDQEKANVTYGRGKEIIRVILDKCSLNYYRYYKSEKTGSNLVAGKAPYKNNVT